MTSTRNSTANIRAAIKQHDDKTLYEILGLKLSATMEEIKSAYRDLAKQHHPDKGGDVEIFKQIQHAFETLADDAKKNTYDRLLNNKEAAFNYQKESFKIFEETNSTIVHVKITKPSPALEELIMDPSDKPILRTLEEDEILYWVGNPIDICQDKMTFRESISREEIINSFPLAGKVKIFRAMHEAYNYARATRQGDFYKDTVCKESAVAKIIVTKKTNNAELIITPYATPETYGASTRNSSGITRFLETDRQNISPLIAKLSVKTLVGNKSYPQISFNPDTDLTVNRAEDELQHPDINCRIM